jgi:type IV pilus assembly protein PilN
MNKTFNLLPWRETARQLRRQAMLATLLVTSIVGIMVVGFVYAMLSSQLDEITGDIWVIDEEITGLGAGVAEIEELEAKKTELIGKNRVLQNIQTSRSETVRLFDELVTAVPLGVTLRTLERKSNSISISGVARSNHDVAALMKSLDRSYLLENAKLEEIEETGSANGMENIFYMQVELDIAREYANRIRRPV